MFRRIAAGLLLSAMVSGAASAGHHYYHSYPAWGCTHVYTAPIYVAPVYGAPVVVHRPAYVVPAPVTWHYYAPQYHSAPGYLRHRYHRSYWPRGEYEVEIKWKRNGWEIEIDYDD